jgi:hypothetical protein
MSKSKLVPDFAVKRSLPMWREFLSRAVVCGIPVGFGALVGLVIAAIEQPGLIHLVEAMLGAIVFVPISLIITTTVVPNFSKVVPPLY